MPKRGTKMHMTELDRGLACAARREGLTIREIAEALYRDDKTLQRLFIRRGITKHEHGNRRPGAA